MRKIETHKVNGLNDAIEIFSIDEPGRAGCNYQYMITRPLKNGACFKQTIIFQHGPIEKGIDGFSNETFLAIVRHRLQGFQSGPFACPENAAALQYTIEAMDILKQRTLDRIARGVEGKLEK